MSIMIEQKARVLTMVSAARWGASEAPESTHLAVAIDAGDACVKRVFLHPPTDSARYFASRPYLGCIPSNDGAGVATAAVSSVVWDDAAAMVNGVEGDGLGRE